MVTPRLHIVATSKTAERAHVVALVSSEDFELEGDDLILERQGNLCLLGSWAIGEKI